MRECSIENCSAPIVGQELCRKHYMRQWRTGSTSDMRKNARGVCSIEGCGQPHQALGLCRAHWQSQSRKGQLLEVKTREARTCAHCGDLIDPAKKRRGPVSYCSRNCKDKAWIAAGKNAIAARKSYFKRRYNLTPEQVEQMAAAGCGICGTTEWMGRHSRPHVDHDHDTGRVRGILCHGCNVSIGHFRHDPVLLQAAIVYLTRE